MLLRVNNTSEGFNDEPFCSTSSQLMLAKQTEALHSPSIEQYKGKHSYTKTSARINKRSTDLNAADKIALIM